MGAGGGGIKAQQVCGTVQEPSGYQRFGLSSKTKALYRGGRERLRGQVSNGPDNPFGVTPLFRFGRQSVLQSFQREEWAGGGGGYEGQTPRPLCTTTSLRPAPMLVVPLALVPVPVLTLKGMGSGVAVLFVVSVGTAAQEPGPSINYAQSNRRGQACLAVVLGRMPSAQTGWGREWRLCRTCVTWFCGVFVSITIKAPGGLPLTYACLRVA